MPNYEEKRHVVSDHAIVYLVVWIVYFFWLYVFYIFLYLCTWDVVDFYGLNHRGYVFCSVGKELNERRAWGILNCTNELQLMPRKQTRIGESRGWGGVVYHVDIWLWMLDFIHPYIYKNPRGSALFLPFPSKYRHLTEVEACADWKRIVNFRNLGTEIWSYSWDRTEIIHRYWKNSLPLD